MSARRIIIVFSAIALILAWYFFAYTPNRAKLNEIETKSRATESQLADYKATAAQLPALIAASSSLAAERQRQLGTLFGKSEVLRLIDEIRGEARAQGMSVADIEPPVSELLALRETAEKPGEPLFLTITVRLKGDYIGFGQFVERVENLAYFRGVTYCSIIGPADQSNPPLYSLGFRALLGEGRKG
jgi:Tfp pilus assembly protein PilO